MLWQDDIQFVMYMCMNSVGSSTVVVSLLTTSIEWRLMSILTSTVKYLHIYKSKINAYNKNNLSCDTQNADKKMQQDRTLEFQVNSQIWWELQQQWLDYSPLNPNERH